MLCAIEDQDSSIHAHGSDDVGVLRLVSCLVHLARMVYLLLDIHLDSSLFAIGRATIATYLSSLLVIIMWVGGDVLR